MATTQLDCSIGIKEESVYGTAVTVDQFLEFTGESLDYNPEFAQSEALRVGSRVARDYGRDLAKVAPGGGVELEAPISGLGILLEAAFGGLTNTEVPTATGVYQQVHTPKADDFLKSYTIQKGIPPVGGGTTLAHTFSGAMCNSIDFSAKIGEYIKIATEWLAKDMVTTAAYAAPSYAAAQKFFNFVHGAIYLNSSALTVPTTTALAAPGGSELASIEDFSVKWTNNLDDGGFNLGGAGKRTRKNVVGMSTIDGSLTAEFTDATLRDAFLNDTGLAMVLTFTRPEEIATGLYSVLQIVVPSVRLNGDLPKSNGGSKINLSIPFTGLDNITDEPIYVVYRTLDISA